MDWIYGYLAALRHTSIVEAAELKWEINDYLTVGSALATVGLGCITFLVSRSAAKAATSAARAAEQANQMNRRAKNTEMRMTALALAGEVLSECTSLSLRHRGREYEIAERIALLKRTLKSTANGAHNTVTVNVVRNAEQKLNEGADLLREAAELIPRSREMFLRAQATENEEQFDQCLTELYDLRIACSTSDSLVGMRFIDSYALAMSVPVDYR